MRTDNTVEPERKYAERKKLWGKNFLSGSEMRYEYYLNGIHQSYPDFVLKDDKGQIHLFEVKSVNVSNKATFDTEEYKEKIGQSYIINSSIKTLLSVLFRGNRAYFLSASIEG